MALSNFGIEEILMRKSDTSFHEQKSGSKNINHSTKISSISTSISVSMKTFGFGSIISTLLVRVEQISHTNGWCLVSHREKIALIPL